MAVKMIAFQNQFVPYTTLIIIIALRYFSRTYIDFIHLVEMELFFNSQTVHIQNIGHWNTLL